MSFDIPLRLDVYNTKATVHCTPLSREAFYHVMIQQEKKIWKICRVCQILTKVRDIFKVDAREYMYMNSTKVQIESLQFYQTFDT